LSAIAFGTAAAQAQSAREIEKLNKKIGHDLGNIKIWQDAIQPRIPSKNENPATKARRDRMVLEAIYNDVARLHNMVGGLKEKRAGGDPKPWCDKMTDYLATGFIHIEGIDNAPERTVSDLLATCMQENKWVISKWEMTCIQPTIVDDNTVHLYVRYFHDQSDYTQHPDYHNNPVYPGEPFVPRIAVRDLIKDKRGRMVIARHSAFDVRTPAVMMPDGSPPAKDICKPLPPVIR
jgi:hypothetical protein